MCSKNNFGRKSINISHNITQNIVEENCLKKNKHSRVLVAHACNPGYSEGRDQEDHGLKPALANGS
jgi:hypothetical protein